MNETKILQTNDECRQASSRRVQPLPNCMSNYIKNCLMLIISFWTVDAEFSSAQQSKVRAHHHHQQQHHAHPLAPTSIVCCPPLPLGTATSQFHFSSSSCSPPHIAFLWPIITITIVRIHQLTDWVTYGSSVHAPIPLDCELHSIGRCSLHNN